MTPAKIIRLFIVVKHFVVWQQTDLNASDIIAQLNILQTLNRVQTKKMLFEYVIN